MKRLNLRALSALLACVWCGLTVPATSAKADPAFVIRNNSGLTTSKAKFYYLGFGQIGNDFMVLMPDGTWSTAGSANTGWSATGWNPSANSGAGAFTGAGVVPCYALNGGETITIPPNIAGSRIYFFQVNSNSPFFGTTCGSSPAATASVNGIFGNNLSTSGGQAPFSYFQTTGGGALTGASLAMLSQKSLPLWSYSEIGSSPTAGTIDTSQVDFIGFPMNVTANMISSPGQSHPVWNEGVGFSFSSRSQVNMGAVRQTYRSFVNRLPVVTGTGTNKIYQRRNYTKLLKTVGSSQVLVNPGNYLSFFDNAAFSNFFLNTINNYMWKPGWTGSIDDGGAFGSLLQTVFDGTAVQLPSYPGYTGTTPLYAIKFTGNGASAYVLSPVSYQILCQAGAIAGCSTMSPAYQIFATDGALNTPIDNNQFQLLSPAEQLAWNNNFGGVGNYNAVVGRLGFIISMAYNHGVAGGLQTSGGLCYNKVLSACWSDQTLWYPNYQIAARNPNSKLGATLSQLYFNGDTTQNQFARWLHTAKIGNVPMMTRPVLPTTSQSGLMGMGYGFAADENPTPPNATYSQTPSKYDSNVSMATTSGCNYITIMPWTRGTANLTPVTNPSCQ